MRSTSSRFLLIATSTAALLACGLSVMGSDTAPPGETTTPPSSGSSSGADGTADPSSPDAASTPTDGSVPVDGAIDVAPKKLPYAILSEPGLPPLGTLVNLTTEGIIDWKHWGHKPSDQSSSQKVGGNVIGFYYYDPPVASRSGYPVSFAWSDGPTGYATMTGTDTLIFISSSSLVYYINIETSSTPRTLTLYAGVTGGSAQVEVSLTDDSVPVLKSAPVSSPNDTITGAKWVIEYATNASSARLNVRVVGTPLSSGAFTSSVVLAAVTVK